MRETSQEWVLKAASAMSEPFLLGRGASHFSECRGS